MTHLLLTCCLLAPVPPRDDTPRPRDATTKAIDDLLAKYWKENDLSPSARTDDQQFLRRLTLDLVGRIATPDELKAFTADRRADKRLRVLDKLLLSDECNQFWAEITTDALLPPWADAIGRERLAAMLRDHSARNGSYKDLVEKLLTATGRPADNPAVVFALSLLGSELPKERWAEEGRFDAIPLAEKVGRTFLAVNLQCIRCHDHPFNAELRQPQFWGMMGFFRQLERGEGKPGDTLLSDNPALNNSGLLHYGRRNGVIAAVAVAFLDGTRLKPDEQRPRRAVLAEHVTRHPHFAKAFVNRTWAHFFGRGLTEQAVADDFNENNPFVHPELIDRLARDFTASGYDPKKLMRALCASDVYQLRGVGLLPPAESFHRAGWRPLSSVQRLNATLTALRADVTLTGPERQALRNSWLAMKPMPFTDCEAHLECVTDLPPTALNFDALRLLLISPEIAAALAHPQGTVAEAMKAKEPATILDQLFLAAFNRYPTARESTALLKQLQEPGRPKNAAAAWQDLFWTMLTTREFIGNR